jgi:hypothetical protein
VSRCAEASGIDGPAVLSVSIKHRTAGVALLLRFQAYTLLGAREISPFSTRVD